MPYKNVDKPGFKLALKYSLRRNYIGEQKIELRHQIAFLGAETCCVQSRRFTTLKRRWITRVTTSEILVSEIKNPRISAEDEKVELNLRKTSFSKVFLRLTLT